MTATMFPRRSPKESAGVARRCQGVMDLLLPATDAGVLVQLVLVAIVASVVSVIARRNRDVRLAVVGLTVLTVGLLALRAVH